MSSTFDEQVGVLKSFLATHNMATWTRMTVVHVIQFMVQKSNSNQQLN